MRGYPLVSSIVLGAAFACAAVPLLALTKRDPTVRKVEESVHQGHLLESVSGFVTVRSAHPYQSVSLLRGEEVLFSSDQPASEFDGEVMFAMQNELILKVSWSEETPETALLIEIEPDGQEMISRTYWAEGDLLEEITLQLTTK